MAKHEKSAHYWLLSRRVSSRDWPIQTLGKQLNTSVLTWKSSKPSKSRKTSPAKTDGRDLVIIDTAGRLHIDSLMEELQYQGSRKPKREILRCRLNDRGQGAVNAQL